MGIKNVLKKIGIMETEKLDFMTREALSKKVATKISDVFGKYGITYEELYLKFINTEMFLSDTNTKSDRVNYIYKNKALYFDRKVELSENNPDVLRGFIYKAQETRNKRGKIVSLGLCDITKSKPHGIALNEAAIQYAINTILETKKEKVKAYGITLNSLSITYPLLTNIVEQLVLMTEEEVLIKSLFSGSKDFKKAIGKLCSRKCL